MAKRLDLKDVNIYYGSFHAVADVSMSVPPRSVTAFIGPSGCGKSTVLRTLNRMHEVIPGARVDGSVLLDGDDIYGAGVDPVGVRKTIGMVFQRPNPLPMSIRDNVLFALRLHRGVPPRAEADAIVEDALRRVGLWERARDRLQRSAESLSLEERQKLCIARLLPLRPRLLLLDEPCSALDPAGTQAIEALMGSMKGAITQVIVTHNLAQARRISDRCAFMLLGELVELGPTPAMFTAPRDPRTRAYLGGEYG